MPAALTRSRTSPSPGCGVSISSTPSTSTSPYSWKRTAFTAVSGAVAALVLLTAPAPARAVAAHLMLVVEHALLDDRHRLVFLAVLREAFGRSGARRGRGGRHRARPGGAAARVGDPARAGGAARGGKGRDGFAGHAVLPFDVDLDVEDHPGVVRPHAVHEVSEQREGLVLVGHERVDLGEAAQVDALAQIVHVEQVLLPALVDRLQQQEPLECAHQLLAQRLLAGVVAAHRLLDDGVDQSVAVDPLLAQGIGVDLHREELPQRRVEAVDVPILDELAGGVLVDGALDHVAHLTARLLADALSFEHLVAVGVDDTALLVHHVVVLQHAFADQEVLLLDLLLRFLDLFREHPRLDRFLVALVVDAAEFVEDPVDAVAREQAHEVVLGREEEAGLTGVALATGTTAELVVDAARLVALGAADEQPARGHHAVAALLDLAPDLRQDRRETIVVAVRFGLDPLSRELLVRQVLRVPAELDVHAAARHVRRDRHGPGLAGLG